MENSIVLYYTGTSRDSGNIIKEQAKATQNEKSRDAMLKIKEQTALMKEYIFEGKL